MTRRKMLFALAVLAAMTASFCMFSRQSASAQQAGAALGGGGGAARAAAAWTGPKWEYKVAGWDGRDTNKPTTLGAVLNEYGAEGWELVTVNQLGDSHGSLCFKRPLADHAVPHSAGLYSDDEIAMMTPEQAQAAMMKISNARQANPDAESAKRLKHEFDLLLARIRMLERSK